MEQKHTQRPIHANTQDFRARCWLTNYTHRAALRHYLATVGNNFTAEMLGSPSGSSRLNQRCLRETPSSAPSSERYTSRLARITTQRMTTDPQSTKQKGACKLKAPLRNMWTRQQDSKHEDLLRLGEVVPLSTMALHGRTEQCACTLLPSEEEPSHGTRAESPRRNHITRSSF